MSATNPLPDNAMLQWVQDELNNDYPTAEDIADVYALYAHDDYDPDQNFLQDDRHHCVIFFKKNGDDVPTATILHHLARFPTRIGNPTPYDGGWYRYGTCDQPIGGHQITVEFPVDMFAIGPPVQTFMPNRIQGEVGNNPDLEQLVPEIVEANLQDLELVTTRRSMWIPNHYVALLLDDAWVRCYGAILQNGHQDACSMLIKVLQAQLLGNDDTSNAYPFESGLDLMQPITTASLIRHRNSILSHLAPAAALSAPPAPAPMQGVSARAFQDLVEAIRNGPAAPAPAAPGSAETTVEKRWSVNLQTLLKLTLCASEAELSPVWSAIAKGPKKEERHILQSALSDLSRSPGASTTAALTVSKDLHSTIVNLMFWSGDPDRLDEGLHPFRTVHTSTAKTSWTSLTFRPTIFWPLMEPWTCRISRHSSTSSSLTGLPPTSWIPPSNRITTSLLLLKATHPYTAAYTLFLTIWNSISIQIAELFATDARKPAQFLRSIQLLTAVYWQSINATSAMEARVLPPPNFVELLTSLRVQSWIPPALPGAHSSCLAVLLLQWVLIRHQLLHRHLHQQHLLHLSQLRSV